MNCDECSPYEWFGVWAMQDGYEGHWHPVHIDTSEPLQTTRTEPRPCVTPTATGTDSKRK